MILGTHAFLSSPSTHGSGEQPSPWIRFFSSQVPSSLWATFRMTSCLSGSLTVQEYPAVMVAICPVLFTLPMETAYLISAAPVAPDSSRCLNRFIILHLVHCNNNFELTRTTVPGQYESFFIWVYYPVLLFLSKSKAMCSSSACQDESATPFSPPILNCIALPSVAFSSGE